MVTALVVASPSGWDPLGHVDQSPGHGTGSDTRRLAGFVRTNLIENAGLAGAGSVGLAGGEPPQAMMTGSARTGH